MKLIIFVLLCIVFYSCEPEIPEEKAVYFNSRSFIESEVQRLAAKNSSVEKTVFINGKNETQTLKMSDWQRELSPFADADISKRSYIGKYKVDSLSIGKEKEIHYTALDENLNIKDLTVRFDSIDAPYFITIFFETKNTLYTSSQQMEYNIREGYTIKGYQNVRFFDADSFNVQVQFSAEK